MTGMNAEQDLIENAINIWRRLLANERNAGRCDIVKRAVDLIALQDGNKFPSELELTSSEKSLGRWIADTIGVPKLACDETIPPGCKLAPLVFSPSYQFHLAQASPRTSCRPPLQHLPRTAGEIEEHLHQWTGNAFQYNTALNAVTGVGISAIAGFLASIRRSHPALFLLLLSEEVEEAIRLLPALQWPNAPGQVAEWRAAYFGNAKCSIAALFHALRITRRIFRILQKLNADDGFNLAGIKHCGNHLPVARSDPQMRRLLKRTNVTAFSLHKIVLMDIDHHVDPNHPPGVYHFRKAETDIRTLARYRCLDGPDTDYAQKALKDFPRQLELTLPVADSPPHEWPDSSDIDVTRVGGRGGTRYGPLANYYGLLPTDLVAHGALCVEETCAGSAKPFQLAEFANALLFASGYEARGEVWIRPEHIRRQAKLAASVFPSKGEFGHATGFGETSWHDLEGDSRLWTYLAKGTGSDDPLGKMFLQLREHLLKYTDDVRKLERIDDAARVFCYLGQSTGLLSSDPVWLRLQERTRAMLRVTLSGKSRSKDKVKPFGDGPKTLGALIAVLGASPDRVGRADVLH
ncbi:hypothetical protein [Erythrobacter sp. MTPC3]|uniref:hypothetical protein n=1 Tax=Erythrobacter sp. MTPC3 TaxID=3056564 RepID=UPI0036F355A8